MARTLTITCGGATFNVAPIKLERSKLYGGTELQISTKDGIECHIGAINSDGLTIVDTGCAKTGMLAADGQWMERDELVALAPDGTQIQPIASSFDTGIKLADRCQIEDLLSINVQSVYQLSGPDSADIAAMVGEDIFTLQFSYRGGYESMDAFLLATEDGVFLITGNRASLDYIGIDQSGVLDDIDDMEMEAELDFSMM